MSLVDLVAVISGRRGSGTIRIAASASRINHQGCEIVRVNGFTNSFCVPAWTPLWAPLIQYGNSRVGPAAEGVPPVAAASPSQARGNTARGRGRCVRSVYHSTSLSRRCCFVAKPIRSLAGIIKRAPPTTAISDMAGWLGRRFFDGRCRRAVKPWRWRARAAHHRDTHQERSSRPDPCRAARATPPSDQAVAGAGRGIWR